MDLQNTGFILFFIICKWLASYLKIIGKLLTNSLEFKTK